MISDIRAKYIINTAIVVYYLISIMSIYSPYPPSCEKCNEPTLARIIYEFIYFGGMHLFTMSLLIILYLKGHKGNHMIFGIVLIVFKFGLEILFLCTDLNPSDFGIMTIYFAVLFSLTLIMIKKWLTPRSIKH